MIDQERRRRHAVFLDAIFAVIVLPLLGCHRPAPSVSGPLPQRGYLWQREWTAAVAQSVAEAGTRMDGVIVLGAEIHWGKQKPSTTSATIDWPTLKATRTPCAIALRVAPFSGPFSTDDASIGFIANAAKSLLEVAKSNGIQVGEFQLDFDCPQKRLAGYRLWLQALRPAISPTRFVITALPAWLDEPDFPALARATDGYILQVHSVPTSEESGRMSLCDANLARKWTTKAGRLGFPFSVALPTYHCLAGYSPAGKLLGVAMDGVQPVWSPETRILEFGSDPDEMAALVKEWQTARPRELRELIWYRLPVATDARNWQWNTLSAVMSGRPPVHKLEAVHGGANPVDVAIQNAGEADEQIICTLSAVSPGNPPIAYDALPGWNVQIQADRAIFAPTPGRHVRLPPGAKLNIGWLRYERSTNIHFELEPHHEGQR
jgi:Protein of unknown function (DUF3142)